MNRVARGEADRLAPFTGRTAANLLVLLMAAVAAVRVASTYHVFSETADEHAHIAAGLEWWDRGVYTYAIEHTPLARIAAALPLYLAGSRSHGLPDPVAEKNAILYAGGRYSHNLALARLGILPFLILSIGIVWIWARRLFGVGAGLAAVLLFSTLSPVLAHSGLATTDAAPMALIPLALLAYSRWLESPTLSRAALFGFAGALAILSKLSALVFFPCAAFAILVARSEVRENPMPPGVSIARSARSLALAALIAAFTVWAGYRFSWAALPASAGTEVREILTGPEADPRASGIRVPAPELIEGIRRFGRHARYGHPAYLFGRYSRLGWPYYFPVALAVKTPLPFLLLSLLGGAVAAKRAVRLADWRLLAPAVSALALLLACLPSRIDIGIRHLLPIYPLLAIAAGCGAAALWNERRWSGAGRVAVVALFAWQVAGSIRAHPDYLADFNELAGSHPDRILLDSNLDWGQDLLRLSDELRARRVDSASIAYFGNADLSRHGLPPIRPLPPDHPTTGWIAISEMWLKDVGGGGKAYAWLRARKPVARVGKSILLYYIPPPA